MNQDSFANFGSMNEAMVFSKEHSEFLTVTCLEWKHVLAEDRFKDIIIDSLTYLTKSQRVYVYGFVIMSTHFHLLWQMIGDHKRSNVQRDFLKYTGQQILKLLQTDQAAILKDLQVNAKDRKHQVWERNSLGRYGRQKYFGRS
jgi:REP element-mobilizing transposase RayT